MSDTKDELRKAIAAHEAAVDRVEALLKELDEAKAARSAAYSTLAKARIVADRENGEPVTIIYNKRHRNSHEAEGIVVRRTKVSVFAREVGEDEGSVRQFRKDRWGVWQQYPAPKGIGVTWAELRFPDEPAN